MTDDELEQRKEETWGMDEVRGGSFTQEDAESISSEEEASDQSDTADMGETEATVETEKTSKTAVSESVEPVSDTVDTKSPKDTEDIEDTADAADTADHEAVAGKSPPKDTSDTSEPEDASTSKESIEGDTVREMALDAKAKGLAVRDLHNVNVYLYEDIHREMVSMFKALDAEYYQEHGEDLSKNKDFFNAVFRAGLSSPRLREELELKK